MQTKEEKYARARQYKLENKEKIKKVNKLWYERNKPKPVNTLDNDTLYKRERVRQASWRAYRKGLISKLPCCVCGEVNTEMHHVDYDMPLDVIWLCKKHHMQLHKEHREYEQVPQ